MGDRPILFTGPMVRATLDGRKTQTRRVVGPGTCTVLGERFPPKLWHGLKLDHPNCKALTQSTIGVACFGEDAPHDPHLNVPWVHPDDEARGVEPGDCFYRVRPIIAPGDRLWVRENHWCERGTNVALVWYQADDENGGPPLGGKVCPSIHMPRWASRLTLIVKDVWVERVQDINEEDAEQEGIAGNAGGAWGREGVIEDFATLWDSINAKRGFGWDDNPWVVAVSFDAVQANIDTMQEEAE